MNDKLNVRSEGCGEVLMVSARALAKMSKKNSGGKAEKKSWGKNIIGWVFKKTSYLIFAIIVTIIAGVVVDILGDFGWIERIKSLLTPK